MNKLRLLTRFYSTPVNIYNFNKETSIFYLNNLKKSNTSDKEKNYSSYKNMYQVLKKTNNPKPVLN